MFTKLPSRITFLVLMLCLAPSLSMAQGASIGVVDVDRILVQSAAGKSIEKQLSARRESFQKEFSARENNLMSSQKTLIERKKDLSAEEFATQRKSFENQLLETRNLFKKRRSSLDKGLGNAMGQLRKHLVEVTAAVADEKGLKIVLTRDSVVIVEKDMDITELVLTRLNAKISNISLNM